ncbi:hypothetical protein J5N97_003722 [Dioscorea zingiberensis]|uniref:Dihydrolipoamide acetyltransferase component of pyruvate dehydrogenase complex n=1 Tax=Dioscorea zingiberensis TaxID=325984 RepID=A0A9D5HQV5_9LILI|nr:hypothetical protein J5N97_003722 [Dioscorea zingiberensis]
MDADNIENRLRTLKIKYQELKKVMGLSGVGWNDNRKMLVLEDESYHTYVASHPKVKNLLNKPIPTMMTSELYVVMIIPRVSSLDQYSTGLDLMKQTPKATMNLAPAEFVEPEPELEPLEPNNQQRELPRHTSSTTTTRGGCASRLSDGNFIVEHFGEKFDRLSASIEGPNKSLGRTGDEQNMFGYICQILIPLGLEQPNPVRSLTGPPNRLFANTPFLSHTSTPHEPPSSPTVQRSAHQEESFDSSELREKEAGWRRRVTEKIMRNIRVLVSGFFRVRSSLISRIGWSPTPPRALPFSPVKGFLKAPPSYESSGVVRWLASSADPPHLVLEMPALSPTMNQGNIAKWRKKEGDKIDVGDVICEIETDKATLEFESLEEGYLAKILAPEGSKDVLVGQPIAITVEDPDDIKNVPTTISSGLEAKEEKVPQNVEHKESTKITDISRISPSAKLLILEYGLDTSSLKASGPHGTLLKGDVLAALKSRGASQQPSRPSQDKTSSTVQSGQPTAHTPPQLATSKQVIASHEDLPNSQIRKVIAKRLLESKQGTPHFYLSSDVILDPLLVFRNQLKEQHNVKVSVNDIIIKAVALALRNVPEANAYWNVEKGDTSLCDSVDISIAVATEKGLMTPIVRNADQKTLSAISSEVKELAEKARAGKLTPEQFQGGTFSISNLGMFPVDHFCAIINPPQACILAVGRGNKVVEPISSSDGTEKPAVVTKMNLTLSADNRVFDEHIGGKFLSALTLNFGDIRRLLL